VRAAAAVTGVSVDEGRSFMATIEQTRYEVTTIGEVPHGEEHQGRVRHRVRQHLGIEAFGVNAMRAVKGDGQVIGEHAEDGVGSRGNEEL
jgi:hypothetical protein